MLKWNTKPIQAPKAKPNKIEPAPFMIKKQIIVDQRPATPALKHQKT